MFHPDIHKSRDNLQPSMSIYDYPLEFFHKNTNSGDCIHAYSLIDDGEYEYLKKSIPQALELGAFIPIDASAALSLNIDVMDQAFVLRVFCFREEIREVMRFGVDLDGGHGREIWVKLHQNEDSSTDCEDPQQISELPKGPWIADRIAKCDDEKVVAFLLRAKTFELKVARVLDELFPPSDMSNFLLKTVSAH